MITVRSNLTGQTLFVIGPGPTTAYMSPYNAREALSVLANSPLGDHVDVILPGGDTLVPASEFKALARLLRRKTRSYTV